MLRRIIVLCLLPGAAATASAQMPEPAAPTVGLSDRSLQITVDIYNSRGGFALPATPGIDATRLQRRKGDLWGGTISYGHSATLYVDFSYFSGDTDYAFRESFTDPALMGLYLDNRGKVDEDWYEARVRWQPARLAFEKVQAYLSFGLTHIRTDDEIRSDTKIPGMNLGLDDVRTMTGKSRNTFANVGMGVGGIKAAGPVNLGFKAELSLLGGRFKADNDLYNPDGSGQMIGSLSDSKTVWGTISRATAFVSVPFGGENKVAGAFIVELGARHYYWRYSGGSEKNYGPFAKTGIAFDF